MRVQSAKRSSSSLPLSVDPDTRRMFRVALRLKVSQPFVFFLYDIISSSTRSLCSLFQPTDRIFHPNLSRFNRTPPWSGRGWGASGLPASPGTGCGSESESRPWSRRKTGRWCGSATGGSCRRRPLRNRRRKRKTQQSKLHQTSSDRNQLPHHTRIRCRVYGGFSRL